MFHNNIINKHTYIHTYIWMSVNPNSFQLEWWKLLEISSDIYKILLNRSITYIFKSISLLLVTLPTQIQYCITTSTVITFLYIYSSIGSGKPCFTSLISEPLIILEIPHHLLKYSPRYVQIRRDNRNPPICILATCLNMSQKWYFSLRFWFLNVKISVNNRDLSIFSTVK